MNGLARDVQCVTRDNFQSKGDFMRISVLSVSVAAALAIPAVAAAQQAQAGKPGVPTLHQMFEASDIAVDGYIDMAYTRLSGAGVFTSGVANRVFDTDRNAFLLHQAAITFARQPKEGFGGLVNLTAGKDADVVAPFDANPGATQKFDVTQAFLHYGGGPLMLIAGKFVTSAGAEVIKSTTNVNYSRSILFGYAIPFTHTGVRANYAVSDKLTVIGGLNNGWDDLRETNTRKTTELGISATPIKDLSLTVMSHIGTERVGGLTLAGPEGRRNLVDVVASYAATEKLTFTLNYDNASQRNAATVAPSGADTAKWTGVAGYVIYQMTDTWRLALRGETFNDKDGYRTGVAQKWKEGTVTLAYLPSKSMEVRGEVRADRSNVSSFVKTDGSAGKSQNSVALQVLYKF